MDAFVLKNILDLHSKWLKGEDGGVRADLHSANLQSANLRSANLRFANLQNAYLQSAYLQSANLQFANLQFADLRSAKFNSATKWPAPTMVLLANWGEVSDTLCLALMRFDCANHPDGPKRFDEWVKTGRCPYDNVNVARSANFQEKKRLWNEGLALHAFPLMTMVLSEKCVKED